MSYADLARGIRLRKRYTQGEIAEQYGVSQAYISALENGEKQGELKSYIDFLSERRGKQSKRTKGGTKKAGNRLD